MVEFTMEFDKSQRHLAPPEGQIYIGQIPGEDEEMKLSITPGALEPLELTTYIDLMVANLKRLRRQAKKRLSAYRRAAR